MRVPDEADIRAPEFPPKMEWVNVAFLRMAKLVRREATLIEFFDFARINSLRTLPYLRAWHDRYGGHGLRVIGVHCPGYSFGTDGEWVAAEAARHGVDYAVLLDPGFEVWREYANKGWPGRYLFDVDGRLRWIHYGEGEYLDCERTIQEVVAAVDPEFDPPPPLDPIRPEDAPGVLLEAQTADIALPADRDRLELSGDWLDGEDYLEAAAAGATARPLSFDAGSAYAVLAGVGIDRPGLYEGDGTVTAAEAGLRLHGYQFTPKT
ncbi:MAG: DipZ protein [Solirubrobacterales bacterium]|nr:DipZ protein [Solirubrobacterales bacterium]